MEIAYMKPRRKNFLFIAINDDFNPAKIAASGQCFRVKELEDGTFRFITGEHILHIKEVGVSSLDPAKTAPDGSSSKESEDETPVPKNFEADCSKESWNTVWHPYFDLDRSYRQVREQIRVRDKYLLAAAKNGLGIRILRQDPWEMLITFIISQQKSIPAIKAAVETLSSRYGTRLPLSREDIYSFPTPDQLASATEEELRECKLGYRAPYIIDAVRKVQAGNLDLSALNSCSDKKLFEALKQISGVGDKVSNCICLFAYGRTRLAPVDTWIKKVIDQKYKGKNPFPKYKDSAGIMQQYIFYYAQTHKTEF